MGLVFYLGILSICGARAWRYERRLARVQTRLLTLIKQANQSINVVRNYKCVGFSSIDIVKSVKNTYHIILAYILLQLDEMILHYTNDTTFYIFCYKVGHKVISACGCKCR